MPGNLYILRDNVENTPCKIIAHGVNSQGVFNAGAARAIRQRWPDAYDMYLTWYKSRPLGSIQAVKTKDRLIINCMTQEYYGSNGHKFVSYDAVDMCLEKVGDAVVRVDHAPREIAMTRLGCGLGGGDWRVVKGIIEHRLCDRNIDVFVYSGMFHVVS